MKDPICGRDGGDRDGVVAESECVGDAFSAGVGH